MSRPSKANWPFFSYYDHLGDSAAAVVFALFTFGAASGHGVESKPYRALEGTKAGTQWRL